jgi:ribosomal protein S18 acetylase RimI-like enzyme
MDKYNIRQATIKDADFLADAIISAEKSMTDRLGLATIFELSAEELKKLIIQMLEEEIDGCEFSISSFFVACYNEEPVAALGGWLEGYFDDMPSSLLKSNLIGYTFPKENIFKMHDKSKIIEDIQIEREMETYQLEYTYVKEEHRGNQLVQKLMKRHFEYAKQLDANVLKVFIQSFENNPAAIKAYEKSGFKIVKHYVSNNPDIFNYMPFNVKLLMERNL